MWYKFFFFFINMGTFDVSGYFNVFFKKNPYSHLISMLSTRLSTQFFMLGAKFLIFEKLLMKTAAGTSFLCHRKGRSALNKHWYSFSFTT